MEVKLNWNGDEALKKIKEMSADKLKSFAEITTEVAKENSPVAEINGGTNKRSITWDIEDGAYRVYTQSNYGGYLELGTSKYTHPKAGYIQKGIKTAKDELNK